MNDAEIRQKVRDRLRRGVLSSKPPDPAEFGDVEGAEPMEIGPGTGDPCSACDLPIPRMDRFSRVFFYPSGEIIRFHERCYEIWDEERRRSMRR